MKTPILPQTHEQARTAYVLGQGSLRTIAEKFNLRRTTVELWSRKEHWPTLRSQREQAELRSLTRQPAVLPEAPRPAAMQEISQTWVEESRKSHWLECQQGFERARGEILRRLECPEDLPVDELKDLVAQLCNVHDGAARLLGLNSKPSPQSKPKRVVCAPVDV